MPYVGPSRTKEPIVKPISYSRFAVFLLVVLELWSSRHFGVKIEAAFSGMEQAIYAMENNRQTVS